MRQLRRRRAHGPPGGDMSQTTASQQSGPAAALAALGVDPQSLSLDDEGTIVVAGPRQ